MKSLSLEIPDQQKLWDHQHATRGASLESGKLRNTPNESVKKLATKLQPFSTVLELGAANGRDARYLALLGHTVYALDFSKVALEQMAALSEEQGLSQLVIPLLWNISKGTLPTCDLPSKIDAVYARSALHLGDTEMYNLAFEFNKLLAEEGHIYIEGKGPHDTKIARSRIIANNLALDLDEGGHLRRVWTHEFSRKLCDAVGWHVLSLTDKKEKWRGTTAAFMSLLARNGTFTGEWG